ncbi:dihydroorotate dehydrogenase (quinone) [Verrucomicrobia bacterium LW23]|nr:dihydroorotate dehydrogenase (quinone) [Verrucomicrobia bacterium LW23]
MITALYENVVRPMLFTMSPEMAHHAAIALLRSGAANTITRLARGVYPHLEREVFGLRFRNPVGLAAGFDKNALALPAWEALGFGYMEIGTITPLPQPGNPGPRIFRLPADKAMINRMGFPNDGADVIVARLAALKKAKQWPSIPVGINIGKGKATPLENAPDDYLACYRKLHMYADYIAVNISSPNTPGLRALQHRDALISVLRPLVEENAKSGRVPILVKIAPDMTQSEMDGVVEAVNECGIQGIIATNTTIDKTAVKSKETGGLSGAPLRQVSTEVVRYLHIHTRSKVPIIGVGGIFTGKDAEEKLHHGASLVQLYTGFIYEGPLSVRHICDELEAIHSGRAAKAKAEAAGKA